jgi:hypothetical protein
MSQCPPIPSDGVQLADDFISAKDVQNNLIYAKDVEDDFIYATVKIFNSSTDKNEAFYTRIRISQEGGYFGYQGF